MSWLEIGIWVTFGLAGLVNAFAFGHSLRAPARFMKRMKETMPKPPEIPEFVMPSLLQQSNDEQRK